MKAEAADLVTLPPKKWWPPNGYLSQWILNQFPESYQGYAIDVGASDGVSINTTYALERAHHWTVVSVEPNPFFHPYLTRERFMVEKCALGAEPNAEATFHIHQEHPESYSSLSPGKDISKHSLYPKEGVTWGAVTVEVKTLDQILERWQFPRLDALCIDTEGTELDVLKGCDLGKWLPKVIICECWEKVGPIDPYLAAFGYKKVAKSIDNYCYLREGK